MSERSGRVKEVLRQLAAEFLNRESNRTSLITVTDIDLSKDQSRAVILCSVFPDTQGTAALDFLKRSRGDFREYVKEHSKLKRIPYFDFDIDRGETNRQRIDNLLQQ